jgi:selenoprotein W-related protein
MLEFKQDIDELTLVPSDGGVFEVFKNGEKIYSKDKTGEFPDEDEIVSRLG